MLGSHLSKSESETIQIATDFARILLPGDVVGLIGPLGSGKTLFIQAICKYFKVDEIVTSPTFTIMNQYTGNLTNKEFNLIHIDLYRIKNREELVELGFNELLGTPNSIFLIEWADKVIDLLSPPYYIVEFKNVEENENHRIVIISRVES
jgi:tRNA threonylcarbamoyladenosine biosynthesis protein TsaE